MYVGLKFSLGRSQYYQSPILASFNSHILNAAGWMSCVGQRATNRNDTSLGQKNNVFFDKCTVRPNPFHIFVAYLKMPRVVVCLLIGTLQVLLI